MTMGPGRKDDQGKVRTDLLPAGALLELESVRARRYIARARSALLAWRHVGGLDLLRGAASELLAALEVYAEDGAFEVARVLTFGATKYGPNNWQKVTPFEDRYYAAALRHLGASDMGDEKDAESGLLHVAHAACCVLFLISKSVGFDALKKVPKA